MMEHIQNNENLPTQEKILSTKEGFERVDAIDQNTANKVDTLIESLPASVPEEEKNKIRDTAKNSLLKLKTATVLALALNSVPAFANDTESTEKVLTQEEITETRASTKAALDKLPIEAVAEGLIEGLTETLENIGGDTKKQEAQSEKKETPTKENEALEAAKTVGNVVIGGSSVLDALHIKTMPTPLRVLGHAREVGRGMDRSDSLKESIQKSETDIQETRAIRTIIESDESIDEEERAAQLKENDDKLASLVKDKKMLEESLSRTHTDTGFDAARMITNPGVSRIINPAVQIVELVRTLRDDIEKKRSKGEMAENVLKALIDIKTFGVGSIIYTSLKGLVTGIAGAAVDAAKGGETAVSKPITETSGVIPNPTPDTKIQ